jgi:hypothetical protein
MESRSLVRRTAAAATAALSMLAAAPASAQAADVFVTIFAERYVVNGQAFDDLGSLERAIGQLRPGAVRLYACGEGTARAQMAAAHRFRDRYLELRVLDVAAPQCATALAAAPRAMNVMHRAGERPYGIDDEAVAVWWYAMMP